MNLYAKLNTKAMIAELRRRGYVVTQSGEPGAGYQPSPRPATPKPIPSQNKRCCKCHSCESVRDRGMTPPPHKP